MSNQHEASQALPGDESYANRADPSKGGRIASGSPDSFPDSSGMLFEQAMAQTRMAICLTDPSKDDNPIIFANRAFRELTGYEEEEILGRNCRFLQGPGTNAERRQQMRDAIENEEIVILEVMNYRKDGSEFWNALHLGPVYDEDGKLKYYFGSQWNVTDLRDARNDERTARMMARELSHRMKNMFAVISGIVNVTGRMRGIEDEASEINARIQALGRAFETTLDDTASGTVASGPAIRAILAPYDLDAGRLMIDGEEVDVPFATISIVGLVLHELAANATRYGAWAEGSGQVRVTWRTPAKGEPLRIFWHETGGPDMTGQDIKEGTGSAIISRMLRSAQGTIEKEWNPDGLCALITVPLGN